MMRSLKAKASSDRSLTIGKVLVAVNLSDHSEATTIYAAEIAQIFDASLTVGYVYQPVPLCEYASETTFTLLEDQRRDLKKMLQILTQKVQKSGVICESAFLVGEPAEQISILAREMGADLVVTACHHPAFLGRIFNLDKGSPVKHRVPCPVLIYHEKHPLGANLHRSFGIVRGAKQPHRHPEQSRKDDTFSRILAPTDFSHRSQTALDYAVKLARRIHGQLTLLHVLPEPSAFDYDMNGFAHGEWEQAKEEAENNLADAVCHAKRTFLEVDAKFRSGPDLCLEIIRTANEISADLLVLSTHGYTGWRHLLFGSDAEKILDQAPCPILVVR